MCLWRIVTGKCSTLNGQFYSTTSFWKHMSMELWLIVATVPNDAFTLGYLHTLQTILKSKIHWQFLAYRLMAS